jgi:hypothetical protein
MGQERQQVFGRGFLDDRSDMVDSNGRSVIGFSNKVGGRVVSAEWHATGSAVSDTKQGFKASFRQAFEVCGILLDVYVARHQNARDQEFGFVRYVNVKNKLKLSQALNNVWIGDCLVWAHEARYDRFAHNDLSVVTPVVEVKNQAVVVRPVGFRSDEGVTKVLSGIKGVERPVEGDNLMTVGSVEVEVGKARKVQKIRRVVEVGGGDLGVSKKEGKQSKM